jgi:pullulanase
LWTLTKLALSDKSTDAVIYELHIRDLSMDPSSNILTGHKGRFLTLIDVKTTISAEKPMRVNAIKDLGATHVELLPVFDFASANESKPTFNWGYDFQNYNVPDRSYSTDPQNRLTELKSAVQALYNEKLRVTMDVLYNHVLNASDFSEEKIVSGYFFQPSGRYFGQWERR